MTSKQSGQKMLTVTLDEKTLKAFKIYCMQKDKSMSDIIRSWIESFLLKGKKENGMHKND